MADITPSNKSISTAAGGGTNGDRDKYSNSRDGGKDRNSGGRGRGRGQSRGRGGRGGRMGFGSKKQGDRHPKGEMGRGEFYSRGGVDKRKRNDEEQAAKRRRIEAENGDAESSNQFTKEEIEAEGRKPKRKVAVMIGYAGTGYKGMQINDQEKTIEGDIFKAFVAAGAISKANADDPKKSSLIRCARTDKGVHAAGNVISLKLIVEDPDIVKTINENLPPQIRVWGFERTNGAFSCYQACDSRWYEYLIPTYSFLPPHPLSFLGKQLEESAEKEGIYETYKALQQDVASFWTLAEETYVKPILDKLDPELRDQVMAAIHKEETEVPESKDLAAEKDTSVDKQADSNAIRKEEDDLDLSKVESDGKLEKEIISGIDSSASLIETAVTDTNSHNLQEASDMVSGTKGPPAQSTRILTPLEIAVKEVKAAYIAAKKAYRISDTRRKRVEEALQCYIGTRNFHNYTIQKNYSDPSAKRVIRSFKVGSNPIYINDTEWLSLKVHGQSFMMHQIRKMIGMAALVVRCGTRLQIIPDSYGPQRMSIPKAPGLGLLLERPVFDSYNVKAVKEFNRETIDFDKYQKEMDEFKQREIYDRIFREEEKDHQFHTFFHHIDHYRSEFFLWVTASGIAAAKVGPAMGESKKIKDESDDEEVDVNGEEG